MAAVDEHGELDHAGTTEVHDRIEGGADRPAGEQHVVHENDTLAVDVERHVRRVDLRREVGEEVVAVEADIQTAEGNLDAFDIADLVDETAGDKIAPRNDADKRKILAPAVPFENLMRDSRERTVDGRLVHDDGLGHGMSHLSPLRRKKGCPTPARIEHPCGKFLCSHLAGITVRA